MDDASALSPTIQKRSQDIQDTNTAMLHGWIYTEPEYSLVPVPSTNLEEAGFMTYIAATRRWSGLFGFTSGELSCRPSLYSLWSEKLSCNCIEKLTLKCINLCCGWCWLCLVFWHLELVLFQLTKLTPWFLMIPLDTQLPLKKILWRQQRSSWHKVCE